MNAVLLALYFLFPPLNSLQAELGRALGNEEYSQVNQYAAAEEIQEKYSQVSYLDEENIDIFPSEYFDELSEGFDSSSLISDLENEKAETFDNLLNENIVPVVLLNSDRELRKFIYGQEEFTAGSDGNGNTSLVSVDSQFIVRSLYNSSSKLIEKDVWTNGGTVSLSALKKKNEYEYSVQQDGSLSVNPSAVSFWDYDKNELVKTFYDASSNPVKVEKYSIGKKPEKILSVDRMFNSDGKISYEEETRYGSDGYTKRNIYSYSSKSSVPDYEYYEDGVLRIKCVYESDDTYTETVYFDGGYSVLVKYSAGVKVSEQFFQNGEEIKKRMKK